MSYRGVMLFADDRIEEVDADGEIYDHDPLPGLFDALVFAGCPLQGDSQVARWDGIIDLRVEDDGRVIAHTSGSAPYEHDMSAVSELLPSWFQVEANGAQS